MKVIIHCSLMLLLIGSVDTVRAETEISGDAITSTFTITGPVSISTLTANTIRLSDGSSTAPSLTFSNDLDTGFLRPAANSITTTVGGSTAAAISSAGEITQPLQPSFLVINSAGGTDVTGDGTDWTATWNSEIYDQGNDFASNTFTAPIDGKYLLCATLTPQNISSANTARELRITTSNRDYRLRLNQSLTQTDGGLTQCAIADMDASDTATVVLVVAGSSKTVDIRAEPQYNTFSGSLIN